MDMHGILWLEMMEFLIFKDGKDFKESKEEVLTVLQKTRKERESFGKKEGESRRNIGYWEGRVWGLIFLHNIKPFSFGGTKALYWRRILSGIEGFI
ncbi:hypothetical protein MTR_7g064820 [Medicago truncatula]|uniref:Uncharacterized protein n=1 Tax=Medicago truncatula TaxID=3880 RepID=G7L5J0_MEDTR|nr:hypothetical protein MTR_7g064820 [Medicago truncatula]